MAKSGMTQRERIIKRIKELKGRLESERLILSGPEEDLLDMLLWSIQEFLKKVS